MSEFENKNRIKSEKILVSLAIFIFAVVVGYNAFYVPNSSDVIEVSSITQDKGNSSSFGFKNDSETKVSDETININTASESELTKLHGIGSAMAKRIIEYRESYGGFTNTEEIKNVRGIGDKLFEKIRTNICV